MSAPENYLPRADSLPGRVCSYFARLPDEELSNKDIALKWVCDPKNILMQLKAAVDAGLLLRDGVVYSAGPNIARIHEAAPAASPFERPKAAGRGRTVPPAIDIEAVEFQSGIPIVNVISAHERWVAKLQSMQAEQWFDIGLPHASVLRSAATTVRKQGKRIRVLFNQGDSETVRVVCLGEKA